MNDRKIILNRIQTPDGTILTSYHRHYYHSHKEENGNYYAVDGGLDYLKRVYDIPDYKELSLYDDEPFEVIRQNLHWGVNYTKDMKLLPETKWTPICNLKTDHIQAILDNGYGNEWFRNFFKQELEYRNNDN